jgi:hypothetical protein
MLSPLLDEGNSQKVIDLTDSLMNDKENLNSNRMAERAAWETLGAISPFKAVSQGREGSRGL